MFARVFSAVVSGPVIQPVTIELEASSTSLPTFSLIGLPNASVMESKDRVFSALRSLKMDLPRQRIVVSLRPVEIPKSGACLDLAIALGILMVQRKLPLQSCAAVGELGLDGRLYAGPEYLGLVASLPNGPVYAPKECWALAVDEQQRKQLYCGQNLAEIVGGLAGKSCFLPARISLLPPTVTEAKTFPPIRVSRRLLRALSLALAGGHHALLFGSPGVGKTYARNLVRLLQPEETHQQIQERRVRESSWGRKADSSIVRVVSPHHTATVAGMVGGGRLVQPGAASWAHHGILFLDELPEFSRSCLEALRQPLEAETITLSRETGSWTLPCAFTLIATANPCPCGFFGQPDCQCRQWEVQRYLERISGPVLDRIDLQVRVTTEDRQSLSAVEVADWYHRILRARRKQEGRVLQGLPAYARQYEKNDLKIAGCSFMTKIPREKLAAWSLRRRLTLWRVAQTIADLDDVALEEKHVQEAYRLVRPVYGKPSEPERKPASARPAG